MAKAWGIFIPCFLAVFIILYSVLSVEFKDSYQRVLVRQYDYLNAQTENKIIFIGTSTLAFGFDMDTMSEHTGKPSVLLGGHIGYGSPFLIEMSKSNLKEGDIVVIELYDQRMNEGAVQLLLTGIGTRYDMMRCFVPEIRKDAFFSLPLVLKKDINHAIEGDKDALGVFVGSSMDERGNMIVEREGCLLTDPYDGSNGWVDFAPIPLNQDFADYLNEYTAYCEERGVQVYYTVQHTFKDQVTATEEQMDERDSLWQSQLKAPLISRSKDYTLDRKYIWDGHCNSLGQIYRTELIYKDLEPYL